MTHNAVRVLVVDDEQPIRKLLRMGLGAEGFAVIEARNGREADALLAEENPDLVLLDLGLPDRNGHEILAAWRADLKTVPVVILSSRTDEAGIVRALELGADDYVTKPFGMKELAARIRVALRHLLSRQGEQPVFRTGALSVDLVRRIVVVDGEEVKLSPKEYDILRILVTHAGKPQQNLHHQANWIAASLDTGAVAPGPGNEPRHILVKQDRQRLPPPQCRVAGYSVRLSVAGGVRLDHAR